MIGAKNLLGHIIKNLFHKSGFFFKYFFDDPKIKPVYALEPCGGTPVGDKKSIKTRPVFIGCDRAAISKEIECA
jgi:hypothetical protein